MERVRVDSNRFKWYGDGNTVIEEEADTLENALYKVAWHLGWWTYEIANEMEVDDDICNPYYDSFDIDCIIEYYKSDEDNIEEYGEDFDIFNVLLFELFNHKVVEEITVITTGEKLSERAKKLSYRKS